MSNLGQILDGLRRERWEEEGLVGKFKSQLNENGIEILLQKGNTFSLKKETKQYFCQLMNILRKPWQPKARDGGQYHRASLRGQRLELWSFRGA